MTADPLETLGLPADADEAAIRRAYLEKVKEHPPERDPAAFERVRDAYDALRDPRRRRRQALLGHEPLGPFASLLAGRRAGRPFVGPGPWLALLQREGS